MSKPFDHLDTSSVLPLYTFTTELVRLHDVATVIEAALVASSLMFNLEAVALWLVDEDRQFLNLFNHRESYPHDWPNPLPLDAAHPLVQVFGERQSMYVPNTALAPRCVFEIERPSHAELAVPLAVGQTTLGVLYLESARVSPFDKGSRMLLDTLINTTSIAVENALLFEKADQAQARYRAVSELTSDYAYSMRVEPDGNVFPEWATESFSRITGFTVKELDSRGGWMSLVHPDDRAIAIKQRQTLLTGRSNMGEFRIITKEGETRYLQDYGRPVWDRQERRVIRIYGAAQDITDRKQSEAELQAALRRAEEGDRLKSQLLSIVSHELRTPLTSIRGQTCTLLDYADQISRDEQMEALRIVDEEAARLDELIGHLLDASRLEAGTLRVETIATDLRPILEEAVNLMAAQSPDHVLEMILPSSLPLAQADPRRVTQVVSNLLDNAIKFSPPGKQVTVEAESTPSAVLVRVRDEGPGIADEHLPRIFERFYRVEDNVRASGVGLGLAICKGLVDAMGGQMMVSSEIGRGSVFSFSLPRTQGVYADDQT